MDFLPLTALLSGFASFFAPCVLPLIPGYIAFIAGENSSRSRRALVGISFAIGFAVVFVVVGALLTSLATEMAVYASLLSRVGGAFLIVFGLFLMGVVSFRFLERESRFSLARMAGLRARLPLVFAFIAGATYALGWSPCVTPFLASVLALAGTSASGTLLLVLYALGFVLPLILLSLFVHSFEKYMNLLVEFARPLQAFAGVFILFIGVAFLLERPDLILFDSGAAQCLIPR